MWNVFQRWRKFCSKNCRTPPVVQASIPRVYDVVNGQLTSVVAWAGLYVDVCIDLNANYASNCKYLRPPSRPTPTKDLSTNCSYKISNGNHRCHEAYNIFATGCATSFNNRKDCFRWVHCFHTLFNMDFFSNTYHRKRCYLKISFKFNEIVCIYCSVV